jgi:hypothetical protein
MSPGFLGYGDIVEDHEFPPENNTYRLSDRGRIDVVQDEPLGVCAAAAFGSLEHHWKLSVISGRGDLTASLKIVKNF